MGILSTLLHILLIIGKILLILLLVVLCLILLVLCAPFGYRARVRKNAEELRADGLVSWLWIVLRARFSYADGKPDLEVFVLGIPVMKLIRKFRRKKGSDADAAAPAESPDSPDAYEPKGGSTEYTAGDSASERGASVSAETLIESEAVIEERPSGKEETKRSFGLKERLKLRREQQAARAARRAEKRQKREQRKKQIREIWDSLHTELFREALKVVKLRGMKMLKHLMPRRLKGWIRFGFDDPSTTGKVTGVLAMIYPKLPKKFKVIPEFQEAVLEADAELRGKIVLIYLLIQGLKILLNKHVRGLIRTVRKRKPAAGKHAGKRRQQKQPKEE